MITLFILSFSSALLHMGTTIHIAILGFQVATTQDLNPLLDWTSPSNVADKALGLVFYILYILANCIADMILLYRCFVLWNSMRPIFIVALVILFLTNVTGFIRVVLLHTLPAVHLQTLSMIHLAYFIANAINTTLLTLATAGQIWWSSREARRLLGHEVDRRYKRVVAMVIESGFLYTASLVAEVSVSQSASSLGFELELFPLVALMAGIAPTLIILRSSLGSSESAVPDSRIISSLRFGGPPPVEASQGSEVCTVDIQFDPVNEGGDLEAPKIERDDAAARV
ncbi:hypothetical protein WG66_011030 [Moniliophthora roreri]|nr:hypothetical protein WG66_011030 [Moniliophthora roreri]